MDVKVAMNLGEQDSIVYQNVIGHVHSGEHQSYDGVISNINPVQAQNDKSSVFVAGTIGFFMLAGFLFYVPTYVSRNPSLPIACGICFIVTLALCVFAKPISARLSLLDMPGERKQHSVATPLMGGLVLLLAIMPVAIAFTHNLISEPFRLLAYVTEIATLAMVLVGLKDDHKNLSAAKRLAISMAIFGAATYICPQFNLRELLFPHLHFDIGLGSNLAGAIFATFCCVSLVNAINMADGKNGLVIGLCIGWLVLLNTRMPTGLLPLSLITLTALIVLLPFNLRGRLFLGDGGAYGLAALISLLTIATYHSPGRYPGHAIGADEVALLYIVPIIDGGRLIIKRWIKGRSPMEADRDHFHHYLQSKLGWPAGLIVYYALSLGLAALAIFS